MTFNGERRKKKGMAVRRKGYDRAAALLLCLVLGLGNIPVSALAAEPEAETASVSENDVPPVPEDDETSVSENDVPSVPEEDAPSVSENDVLSAPKDEVPSAPEEDAPSVSENDLPSVSENDLPSVSENSLDAERGVLVKAAQEAFEGILSEKPLMALLYHTDTYCVRREADLTSGQAASLEIGHTLYIQGVEITEDDVWYQVQYLSGGAEGTGYVQRYYLAYSDEDWLAWEEEYLLPILELDGTLYGNPARRMRTFSAMRSAVDDSDISAFPESYQADLRSLKNAHPNWTFVPMRTGLDFNTSVTKEMGDKSLIQKTNANASKGWVGSACPSESGWYYATNAAVAYHMDPRNFLTETYIFQFEQLTYNASYHTEAAVQSFLDGTFMKGQLPDDAAGRTYARAFYEIGSGRKLSPIHLASRVYQEQGKGTSGLISGTYPGYEGYYNFFNVGVNGSSDTEKIVKGLTYAKDKGWNTRYKSLEGGAATIGNNYILKGQDTIYLEKFNVDKNSSYGVYNHQYMQNIQAPGSESSSTRKMYANAGSLNSAFVFKIPVFENMPNGNGGTEEPTEPEKPLESIALDKVAVTLRRSDTVVEDTGNLTAQEKAENTSTAALQVSFAPADTTSDKTIVWTSSNPKIATVKADSADSSRAVVTAVGTGNVKITAKASKAGNKTAVCNVSVIAPIYRLELSDPGAEGAEQTELFKGQSVSLNAEYWPKDTTSDNTVIWTTSDEAVATVKNGRVTAQGEGTAKITASVAGYSASYNVAVKVCNVVFYDENGTVLKTVPLGYGESVGEEQMPDENQIAGKIFRGWYTKENGQGSVFTASHSVYAAQTQVYPHYQEIGSGKGFYVIPVGDQTYTGSAIKPKVHVYDGTVNPNGELIGENDRETLELVEGRDYTLSYKNNKSVSLAGGASPVVVVKGKGNYAGTEYVYFDILPKALTDHDIVAEDVTVAYSGKMIKAQPVLYRDGKKLARNRDYTLSYPQTGAGAYRQSGTYPVVVTGKGGYTGRITVYEIITTDVLFSKVNVAKIPNQTYSNEAMKKEGGIRPESLSVTYKKQPLVEGKDYTATYSNDQSVGKATVTLTAVAGSGYAGSKSVTYQIVGTSIARAKVEGLENKTYAEIDRGLDAAGDEYEKEYQKMLQTPGAYTLTVNGRTLVESKDGINGDYVVSYGGAAQRGAAKVGTATIVFKGINEYSGQLKKNYKIQPCALDAGSAGFDGGFTFSYYTQDEPEQEKALTNLNGMTTPYVKGGSKPVVLLYFRGNALTPGKDYSISYQNNRALTTADMEERRLPRFTITGRGNFKGKLTGTFVITEGQFERQITVSPKDAVYREKKDAYRTKPVLKDVNGAALVAGKDYERDLRYTYEADAQIQILEDKTLIPAARKAGETVGENDILPVGAVIRVTAVGMGAYAGTGGQRPEVSAVYRVVSADLAGAKVKVAAKSYQDGRPVTLAAEDLAVTVNGVTEPLVLGKDYVIVEDSYINYRAKGNARVTLRGIGNYGGTKTVTYKINAKLFGQ